MVPKLEFRRGTSEEVIDLRHAALRQGLPRESAIFPGDEAESSRHYVVVDAGQIVSCATLHLNEWKGQPAWQLRGMATDSKLRGKGVGTAILEYVEADLLADTTAPRLLWCNARAPAAQFYRRLGWQIESDEFDIPTAGPHYRMAKSI